METYCYRPESQRFVSLAIAGSVSEAAALLGEQPDIVSDCDDMDQSPLHRLAVEGCVEGVRLLLAARANPNAIDCSRNSVLGDVASLGFTEIAKLLIENGADVGYVHPHSRATALHLAARHCQDAAMFDLLVAQGCDVNIQDHLGETPLHYAAAIGNLVAAARLLALGAERAARNDADEAPVERLPAEAPTELKSLLLVGD